MDFENLVMTIADPPPGLGSLRGETRCCVLFLFAFVLHVLGYLRLVALFVRVNHLEDAMQLYCFHCLGLSAR